MHKKKKSSLEDILTVLCMLGLVISFFMLIGTAGAVDCNQVTINDVIPKGIIWIVVMLCSVIGIIKLEKEDSKYDRL